MINKKLTPFRWCMLQTFPFIEATFDAIDNYGLLCKIVEYVNKNIDKTNELGIKVEELNNWFNNLDVQNEVNKKLDEMAESGELEQIINTYLNTITFKVFNSVEELKASQLISGQYAETLGYYSKNDGGNAKYIIVDGMYDENDVEYIPLNNGKFAKLLTKYDNSTVNVKSFGAKGDGLTDDINSIQNCVLYCADNNLICFIPSGTYLISHQIITALSDVDIRANENFVIIGEGNTTKINKFGTDETFKNMFDFNYLNNLILKNIYSDDLGLTLVPNEVYFQGFDYWSNWLKKKHFDFENCFGTGEGVQKLITLPAPANTGRYGDKHYDDYPLKIVSNSGYNAIEIENFGYNQENELSTPEDNSAIGIIDNVTNSTGVIFIDMKGDRSFERYVRGISKIQSVLKPGTVFEVSKDGHISIGCSTDYNDFKNSSAIKVRDENPEIALFDALNGDKVCIIKAFTADDIAQGLSIKVNGETAINFIYKWLNNTAVTGATNLRILQTNFDSNALKFYNTENFTEFLLNMDRSGRLRIGKETLVSERAIVQQVTAVSSANRPNLDSHWRVIGTMIFDTTLNKPIWWNGTRWVDANGNAV